MALLDTIRAGIREAMLRRDEVRLTTLRSIVASVTNEQIARKVPVLLDDDIIGLIRRSVKQHKDSTEQFEKGGRSDLAANERAELGILEEFLPAMMERADIKKTAAAMIKTLAITDKSKAGMLTGVLMKELKGKADGADVKAVVDELLS